MMKTLICTITVLASLLGNSAFADGRYSHRGSGFNNHGFTGNHFNRGHFSRPSWNNRYYGGFGNRYYSGYGNHLSFSFSNHRYRHYDHFTGTSFVGGLLLGSVLSNSHDNSYARYPRREKVIYRSYSTVPASTTVVRSNRVVSTATTGRRLLKDLEGRCYERFVDENGDEIRVELEPEECRF